MDVIVGDGGGGDTTSTKWTLLLKNIFEMYSVVLVLDIGVIFDKSQRCEKKCFLEINVCNCFKYNSVVLLTLKILFVY